METLETLRRRLDSVEDMQSIVKTMKVLSAVSIRQFEEAAASVDDYMRTVEMGFQIVLRDTPIAQVVPRHADSDGRAAFVVFGSGHGMCGRFNDQMAAFADDRIAESHRRRHQLVVLGHYIRDNMVAEGRHVDGELELPQSVSGITNSVQEMLLDIDRWRRAEEVEEVFLLYQRPTAGMSSEPEIQRLLPIDRQWLLQFKEREWPTNMVPTYRTEGGTTVTALVREYLFVSLYRAFADSLASEHASRLASMQRAERKIDERWEELHRKYHQERQRKVTEEVLDVMGGVLAAVG